MLKLPLWLFIFGNYYFQNIVTFRDSDNDNLTEYIKCITKPSK